MAELLSRATTQRSRWWSMAIVMPPLVALLLYVFFSPSLSGSIGFVTDPNVQLESTTVLEIVAPFADFVEGANLTLFQRDEFACKKGIPCKQFACCGGFNGGDTGECGLGPTWCGADCDSQCNARAECMLNDP